MNPITRLALAGLAVAAALLARRVPRGPRRSPAVSSDALPSTRRSRRPPTLSSAQAQTLPAFLAKVEAKVIKRAVVLDPTLDAGTGQQTAATQKLDRGATDRMVAKFEQLEVLPFQRGQPGARAVPADGHADAGARREQPRHRARADRPEDRQRRRAGTAMARADGIDMSPLPYYRDSPVLVKDKVVEGYVRTSATPPGSEADAHYLERIAAATVINEATALYNAGGTRRRSASTAARWRRRRANRCACSTAST